MKILIVNTLYAPNRIGGAEKSVQTLAENFTLLGHTVKVICLDKKQSNYEVTSVSVRALKIKNNYWPFGNDVKNTYQKFLWHLKDAKNTGYNLDFEGIIKEFKPDILFTNNLSGFSSEIWSIAISLRVKIVHTLRDYYLQCPKSIKFKNFSNCGQICLECKALSKFKKRNSHQIDYVVGISKFILEDHIANGYFNNVPKKVVYNGFDIEQNENKRIKTETIVFGFIGQIKESKGIELLLKCFSKVTGNNWELLVAGKIDTTYLAHLKLLNDSPKVNYLGYMESKDFFKKIDMLVVPSLWDEPFGRVVIESFINKTPVLASNVGGISELMNTNKEFLFETSQNDLAHHIERVLLNPKVLESFSFDQNFLGKFSINETVQKYLEIFDSLLNNEQ